LLPDGKATAWQHRDECQRPRIGCGNQSTAPLRDRLGICQWFHYEDYEAVRRAIGLLRELDVRLVRTGISWADYHRERGRIWYDWLLRALQDFDVLLSIWHTPPSISEGNACASPPRRLRDYADFIALIIDDYRDFICELELWNEPNNRFKWDFQRFDPDWRKFAEMIGMAAYWARHLGPGLRTGSPVRKPGGKPGNGSKRAGRAGLLVFIDGPRSAPQRHRRLSCR
jgi:hypothetical protein